MIGALIIVLREVIEAGLIVGIVLAVTKTMPGRAPYIWGGVAAGLLGAGLVAAFAGLLSNAFEGAGQELFNAAILALAVVMLTWHNVWMARHGRELTAELRRVGGEVSEGSRSLMALSIVVGIAILREGSEVVLFLYGVVISSHDSGINLFIGGVLGLALGVGVCVLTYTGLVIIPARHLFRVTSLLIAFMAAGMAAQCIAFLEQADIATKSQPHALEHLDVPAGQQPAGPGAAYAARIHRPADAVAGARLSRDAAGHFRPDEADVAAVAAKPAPRRQLKGRGGGRSGAPENQSRPGAKARSCNFIASSKVLRQE